MNNPRIYLVSSIVIRQRELGEADRILTLFSRERGKLSAIAKGIRRARSKLAGSLQLFSLADLQLASGRSLDIVTQARARDAFYHLRSDYSRYTYASYIAELLDSLTDEGLNQPGIFDLLASVFHALDAGAHPPTLTRAFELKLLSHQGYGPELDSCAACGGPLGRERGFSIPQGGIVCHSCLPSGGLTLSASGARALHELRELSIEVLSQRRLSEATRRELELIMRAFVDFRLERQLHSAAFLTNDA